MKLCFVLCLLLLASAAIAQPPDTLWTRTYGGTQVDEAWAVCQTIDGSFISAGKSRLDTALTYDILVVKTDALGNLLWSRRYGGPDNEQAKAVTAMPDGGCVVTGYTESYGAGQADIYAVRLNSSGDTLWTRTYGGQGIDIGNAIVPAIGGGCLIVGQISLTTTDMYAICVNDNGATRWIRAHGTPNYESALAAHTLADGYLVAGYVPINGNRNIRLLRLNTDGDTLWTRMYGGPAAEEPVSVFTSSDGGYMIAGWTESYGAGNKDFYLIRTNVGGDTIWTRTYGSSRTEWARAARLCTDGGYLIGGASDTTGRGNDFYYVKVTPAGDVQWTRRDGGNQDDQMFSLEITGDGGFIAGGKTSSYGAGLADFYIIRSPGYSGLTGIVREVVDGTPIPDVVVSAAGEAAQTITDRDGFYTLTLVPGVHTIVTSGACVERDTVAENIEVFLDSLSTLDLAIGKPHAVVTQTSINMLSRNHIQGADTLWIYNEGSGLLHYRAEWGTIAPTAPWFTVNPPEGDVAVGDSFGVAVEFLPDTTDDGVYDFYGWLEVHMNSCPDSVKRAIVIASVLDVEGRLVELPELFDLVSYPNPFNAQTTLLYSLPKDSRARLTIYDVMGREVATLVDGPAVAGVHRVSWDASRVGSGIYFARLETADATLSRKLMLVK